MVFLKKCAYYLIWTVYYLFCIGISGLINLAVENLTESPAISWIILICAFLITLSPFFVAQIFVNKLYKLKGVPTGVNKKSHSKRWGYAILFVIFLFLITKLLDQEKSPIVLGDLGILSLNISLMTGLFSAKFNDSILPANIPVKESINKRKKINFKLPKISFKKPTKRTQYIIAGVFALLIITNPGVKSFKEYMGRDSYRGLSRKYNFFLFSIYECGHRPYFGMCENFIEIGI